MKNVQGTLRYRQALLTSLVVTLISLILYLIFNFQARKSEVNISMSALVDHMQTVFNDNELIADATGVRYQQIHNMRECNSVPDFSLRDDGSWAINGHASDLNPDVGSLISKTRDHNARCMYAAAEYIRQKINDLNPERFDTHRYIISKNTTWFYWFDPKHGIPFHFSDSKMAKNPESYFTKPVLFYDRLLNKDVKSKSDNATDFYIDRITGDRAYSIVSYIYDLSNYNVSDKIVGYVLYDHSERELKKALIDSFNGDLPPALKVVLVNTKTNDKLCLTSNCNIYNGKEVRAISNKYLLHFSLPVYLYVITDKYARIGIWMSPFLFFVLVVFVRYRLNKSDFMLFSDSLTGCFNRKILSVVKIQRVDFFSMIVMDCNNFKYINDTWGHSVGDLALQVIAHKIISGVRENNDLVIRSGGDEFIVLLNKSDHYKARDVAIRIAESIAKEELIVNNSRVPLSISWGVSQYEGNIDVAIQKADSEMYLMKKINKKETSRI